MDFSALFHLTRFATDAALTAGAAWLFVAATGHACRGWLEAALAWGLAGLALVAGAGVVLGEIGGLGPHGFLALHALCLGGLLVARRRHLAADRDAAQSHLREFRRQLASPGVERAVGLGLLLVLAALTALAALAEPTVFDALTYHLPRVGQWLQDGRIGMLATAEERMNFVAAIPEVITAWLVLGTPEGFRLAVVPQALGGILTLGATIGLARQTGLGRRAALLAGALLFGMANVAVQFTAAQTDLLTTGIFSAAFSLWLAALRRGEASTLGAVGVGLALGAKGTVFYLAPSALGWVLWLGWHHPLPPSRWGRTVIAAALGAALFAGPGLLRNWQAYGDVLGPRAWVEKVHKNTTSPAVLAAKLSRNLAASLAQNCEPHAQPHGLREAGRQLGTTLAAGMTARDGFTLDGLSRGQTLMATVIAWPKPDADVTAFGLVTLVIFALGTSLAAIRWRRRDAQLVLLWSAGVAGFLIYYHAMQQWHEFGFRYFVLLAPWIAVVAAWGLEQLPGRARTMGWIAVLLAAGDVGWHVTTQAATAGWQSLRAPQATLGYHVALGWREWSQQLEPAGAPLRVALRDESPVAGFYRQAPARLVTLQHPPGPPVATAEDFVRGVPGWTIVAATRFLGREGRVAARVWTFYEDERSPYSVAAYRALRPGEEPAPVLYRRRTARREDDISRELLIKTWDEKPVCFLLVNPGAEAVNYEATTPLRRVSGRLAAGERATLPLALPANAVAEVSLAFRSADGRKIGPRAPTVELAP